MKTLMLLCSSLIMLFIVCACDKKEQDFDEVDSVVNNIENILVSIYYKTYPAEGTGIRDYIQLNPEGNVFKFNNEEFLVADNIFQWLSEEHKGNCIFSIVSGQFKGNIFTVSDITILKEADFPEFMHSVQGQWILVHQVDDTSGSKTDYSLEDTPFWMMFSNNSLTFRNSLSNDGFYVNHGILCLREVEIEGTIYPCFFYEGACNYYVVKYVDDNTLIVHDNACEGVSYTFSKMQESPLSGTMWKLHAFCDISGDTSIVGSRYNLTINFNGTTYSGFTVVNTFFGEYATDDSIIRLLYGVITLVYAGDETDNYYDDRYERAIFKVSYFDYSPSDLKLFYSDTEYLLFHPQVPTD